MWSVTSSSLFRLGLQPYPGSITTFSSEEESGVIGRILVPVRKDGIPFLSGYDAFDASQRLKTIELHRSIPNLRY